MTKIIKAAKDIEEIKEELEQETSDDEVIEKKPVKEKNLMY